jgi:hypothetical protein
MDWGMWRRAARSTTLGLRLHTVLMLAGCASGPSSDNSSAAPPQQVMEDGNYARFVEEIANCWSAVKAAWDEVALFNLGFVHAYPPSPTTTEQGSAVL